ncbi:MAG TPA: hypothetical protein VE244_03250 [Nitrososphaeraceae archaeon]|nr:hypothetical protein [Nitrososphaeraceae archaeon]
MTVEFEKQLVNHIQYEATSSSERENLIVIDGLRSSHTKTDCLPVGIQSLPQDYC